MQEDRTDAAEADEDGGGGTVFFSAWKPLSTGKVTTQDKSGWRSDRHKIKGDMKLISDEESI